MLHGVGLDHTMWAAVTELLAPHFNVSALDLLGHGNRPAARDGTTLADLAEDVARDISPGTHVVGFSLGALVGQHLALHRPELVASLSCVSSVCQRTASERAAVLARLASAEADFPASVAASLHRWFPGSRPDTSAAVASTERVLLANNVRSYLNCYRIFATADQGLAPELVNITAPTLAITGAEDPGSTPEMTHRLAAAIPHCEAVVVPHARHLLPVQNPQALASAIDVFIGEKVNAN